jgi:hypothetical protein
MLEKAGVDCAGVAEIKGSQIGTAMMIVDEEYVGISLETTGMHPVRPRIVL